MTDLVAELRERAERNRAEAKTDLGRPDAGHYYSLAQGYDKAADLLEADPQHKAGIEAINVVRLYASVQTDMDPNEIARISLECRDRALALLETIGEFLGPLED